MSSPLVIDIEVTSPDEVDLEVAAPVIDVTPGDDGAQVVLVAVPGPPGPAGPPGSGSRISNETPAGARDGVNTVFTLTHPYQSGTTAIYRNGLREVLADGYLESGPAQITFTTAPLPSDVLLADYLIAS